MKTAFIFILLASSILGQNIMDKNELQNKISRFAPTVVKYDSTSLTENEKTVLQKLYEASKIMDEIFLDQVYSKNKEVKESLQDQSGEQAALALEYFNIMMGPFDRLDHNNPFAISGAKPAGAGFYPEDITKEEFNAWLEEHPEDREAFTSEFTVIRRSGDKLTAIPYSEFYREPLSRAAKLLREAAGYADNPSLKKYLELRADAFVSNDYYESDMAWMDLKDHTIEVVIGPYEVYEDELFNYKASFESFVTIKDAAESEKLSVFASYLKDIENHLPIADKHKNTERGSESPIMVVNLVYSGGDTKAGVQTLAFNLPNDERVRQAKGSKKVMLKNIHEAKFAQLLEPIAAAVLTDEQLRFVTFDAFFNHTLMHEMSHGVGPGFITVNGRETEVKKELKETYSTLEECKADILGMYNNIFMIEKGVFTPEFEKQIWTTFLAGIFRSVRFGINEAHGGGNAIIYNYLLENGAFDYEPEEVKVKVNYEKIYPALKTLANKVLTIQAEGDYEEAKKLIEQYAVNSPSITAVREKLNDLPVDIKPIFMIEQLNNTPEE